MRRCPAIKDRLSQPSDRPLELKPVPMLIGAVLLVLAVGVYFRYRHTLSIEHDIYLIQSLGVYGIVFDIFLMAFLCVLPVPSEALIFVNMEIYGIFWGLFYSWVGAVFGAVAAMYLTRWFGQPLVRRLFSERRQKQVDDWVRKRGTLGLLALRFVPLVPFHALNYASGLLSVSLWPFAWTTAVGIIPFDLAMGAVFLGLNSGMTMFFTFGVGAVALLVALGYIFRRKWFAAFGGTDGNEEPSKREAFRRE